MSSPVSERMLGESTSFLGMQEKLSRLAPLRRPVLVVGERGTGKELVASRLHYLSPRWDQPFLGLNCAAFNDNLLESQLFGHETGAFTGASRQQKGIFERADKGTLFLDELASSSMAVQEKLLRVTEYGEIERLGSSRPIVVDVRLVAASNVDLPTLAAEGRFREDLLDRLAFDVITLPPLRARRDDIPLLAEHFALGMARELGQEWFAGFSDEVMTALLEHAWPGNIRELKNVVERAVYQNDSPQEPVTVLNIDPFDSPWRPQARPETTAQRQNTSKTGMNLKAQVKALEIEQLRSALASSQYNQKEAARKLGLSYDQLRGYLRKYSDELKRDA